MVITVTDIIFLVQAVLCVYFLMKSTYYRMQNNANYEKLVSTQNMLVKIIVLLTKENRLDILKKIGINTEEDKENLDINIPDGLPEDF